MLPWSLNDCWGRADVTKLYVASYRHCFAFTKRESRRDVHVHVRSGTSYPAVKRLASSTYCSIALRWYSCARGKRKRERKKKGWTAINQKIEESTSAASAADIISALTRRHTSSAICNKSSWSRVLQKRNRKERDHPGAATKNPPPPLYYYYHSSLKYLILGTLFRKCKRNANDYNCWPANASNTNSRSRKEKKTYKFSISTNDLFQAHFKRCLQSIWDSSDL